MIYHNHYSTERSLWKTTCFLAHACPRMLEKWWSVLKCVKKQKWKREKEQWTFRVNRYQSKKYQKTKKQTTYQNNTPKYPKLINQTNNKKIKNPKNHLENPNKTNKTHTKKPKTKQRQPTKANKTKPPKAFPLQTKFLF